MSTALGRTTAATARTTPVNDSAVPETKTNTEVMSWGPSSRRAEGGGVGRRSPAAPGGGVSPRDQHVRTGRRPLVGGGHRLGHQPVVGREVADRVGAGGVAGELEGLAPAAAEVELAAVAAAAGLGHPVGPAEALEQRGPLPDPRPGVLP